MTLPTRAPIWTIGFLFVGLAVAVGTWAAWLNVLATPAQRFYLKPYVRSAVPRLKRVDVIDFRGPDGRLRIYPRKPFHAWLDATVYGHGRAFLLPLCVAGVLVFACLIYGARKDRERYRRLFIDGWPLRGTEMLTWRQWNRRRKGNGFRLRLA
jgi:hypothetical protein